MSIHLTLDRDAHRVLSALLNEFCLGIQEQHLPAELQVERQRICEVSELLWAGSADVRVSPLEIRAIRQVCRFVVSELGAWDLSSRAGVTLDEVDALDVVLAALPAA